MPLQIDTSGSIIINGEDTGLKVTQLRDKTAVYSTTHDGADSREHAMPNVRYSLAHHTPIPRHATPELAAKFPPPAGLDQFEADIRALIAAL